MWVPRTCLATSSADLGMLCNVLGVPHQKSLPPLSALFALKRRSSVPLVLLGDITYYDLGDASDLGVANWWVWVGYNWVGYMKLIYPLKLI